MLLVSERACDRSEPERTHEYFSLNMSPAAVGSGAGHGPHMHVSVAPGLTWQDGATSTGAGLQTRSSQKGGGGGGGGGEIKQSVQLGPCCCIALEGATQSS